MTRSRSFASMCTGLLLVTLLAYVSGFSVANNIRAHRLHRLALFATAGDGTILKYCEDVTRTRRRPTRTVEVGKTLIGSAHPVTKQTMTTTVTRDVDSSVAQVLKIAAEGADLVRLTVQGRFEADACMKIREALWAKGCDIPLVADIHFAPAVAMRVADAFEKVRINPGNFADGIKKFDEKIYDSKEEFDADVVEIEKLFAPLVLKCKEKNRAIRIGTNHGSLSARVLSFWGDTPRGMVESAMEFADICRKYDFHNFVFSMKASNPLVMVQAYRLLAAEMYQRGWDYPLHLGVTEAGEGEDGRMKSAIGIGSLLADGLGDTVRVSLTEDPELELKPCKKLVEIGEQLISDASLYECIPPWEERSRDFTSFERRQGQLPTQLPGDDADVRGFLNRDGSVLVRVGTADLQAAAASPAAADQFYRSLGAKMAMGLPFRDIGTADTLFLPQVPRVEEGKAARKVLKRLQDVGVGLMAPLEQLQAEPVPHAIALLSLEDVVQKHGGLLPPLPPSALRYAVQISGLEPAEMYATLGNMCRSDDWHRQSDAGSGSRVALALLEVPLGTSRVHASRRAFQMLQDAGVELPVVHSAAYGPMPDSDEMILRTGSELGALLVDGLGDGVMLSAPGYSLQTLTSTAFSLLQGSRMRSTKTDFVSCPSCGRTLFDLQEVTEQIKSKTGHLPGVSIAVMGCIVNGPGEMADADFGYVGGAPGKVDLYVRKDVVQRGIPNELACDALVQLIKDNGRWVDPPSDSDSDSSDSGSSSSQSGRKELVEHSQ